MACWDANGLPLRREMLFGDRVVLCRADRPESINAMLAEVVARKPQGEALVAGALRLSWAELESIVAEVAGGLARRGIGRGDRVAMMIGNRAEFVILFYAIVRLGAICVPISTREAAAGVAYVLDQCGASLLVHESGFADRLPSGSQLAHAVPAFALAETDDLPLLDGLRASPLPAEAAIAEEDTALVLYTSGTTGKPKGAMLAHVNVVHAAMTYVHVCGLGEDERAVVTVPLSHVTGITGAIMTMLCCGGTLIVMREFRAPEFLELAAVERMTQTVLVPAMYALCLARADFARHDLSAWRIGCFGGAPMPAPVIAGLRERLPNLGLINLYGSTETVSAQAIMPPQFADERREWVGLAIPGGEIAIMDSEGRELPRGEPGEIWLKSASVVRGYWDNPQATQEAIVAGFWKSGDLGLMDEEGFVKVLDRIKEMINRGGYKVYSAEVESVLSEHPAVLECAVIAKPCPILGERVHAFIALRDQPVSEAQLAAFCERRLADYKRPESFTIQTEPLPRNANGKLLKRVMRESLAAG